MQTRQCKLGDGRIISEEITPYIVAEVNTSHGGDMETAKEMIRSAKEVGCDCVKFQSWSAESLYSRTYYKQNPISQRLVKKFSLASEDQKLLAEYCRELNISFSSTPYAVNEVDFLLSECGVPYIKVASMDLNNYPFLEYIARTGTAIVLATGMADLEEIKRAVDVIEKQQNHNICLLHCISIYPPEISTIRLKNIVGLKREFPDYPIGFSDHSLGTEMDTAAIALGACLIEKHLTLDKSKIGMDNQMATEPEEFAQMIQQCRNVYIALGDEKRVVGSEEIAQREKMRRSVIVTRDMKKGETIAREDLDVKRPGIGIPPGEMMDLIGRQLKDDIEQDTLLMYYNLI